MAIILVKMEAMVIRNTVNKTKNLFFQVSLGSRGRIDPSSDSVESGAYRAILVYETNDIERVNSPCNL